MRTDRLIYGVLFSLLAASLFAADADLRTWSSSGGGHTLKAEYLGKKGKDKAYLLKEDGRLVTVRLDALSEDDRAFIEEAENSDVDWTEAGEPDKAYYKKARKSLAERLDEIETWKDDEDFQDVGFDPAGPFFRWQLQVKKVQKDLSRQPMGDDKKTNIGALADAAAHLLKLGDEYAESGGDATARSRKESEYVRGVFDSLTDDPAEGFAGGSASSRGGKSDEPNPFEEETSAVPKKSKKPNGPKSREPKMSDGEADEEVKSAKDRSGARRNRSDDPFGMMSLFGAFVGADEDEEETAKDDTRTEDDTSSEAERGTISYSQYQQVKSGMTKQEVFAILGKGSKINVPLVNNVVKTGIEAYYWKNDDLFGGCEITFRDGKVEHKVWSGPGN